MADHNDAPKQSLFQPGPSVKPDPRLVQWLESIPDPAADRRSSLPAHPNPLGMHPVNPGSSSSADRPSTGQGQAGNQVGNAQFTFQHPAVGAPAWPLGSSNQQAPLPAMPFNTSAAGEQWSQSKKRGLNHDDDAEERSPKRRFSGIRSFARRQSGAFETPRPSSSSSNTFKDISNVGRQILGRVTPSNLLRRVNSISSHPSTTTYRNVRIQIAVMGDREVGKTSLIRRFIKGEFAKSYAPTEFDMQSTKINNENWAANVEMWDISPSDGKPHPMHQAWFDACIICFNVRDQDKLESIQKWVNLRNFHCERAPIFLVGLKKDTRPLIPSLRLRFLNEPVPVSAEQGHEAAKQIGAVRYFECSAKTGDGVNELFDTVLQTAGDRKSLRWKHVDHRERSVGKRFSNILGLSRK